MKIYIPLLRGLDSQVSSGTYRVNLEVRKPFRNIAKSQLPVYNSPRSPLTLPFVNKTIQILKTEYNPITYIYSIEIDLIENSVSIASLIAGLLTVLGLATIFMTFRSIERLVEVAPETIAIIAIISIAILVYWFKK